MRLASGKSDPQMLGFSRRCPYSADNTLIRKFAGHSNSKALPSQVVITFLEVGGHMVVRGGVITVTRFVIDGVVVPFVVVVFVVVVLSDVDDDVEAGKYTIIAYETALMRY